MTAANTDKLKKYLSLFSTTLTTGIGTGTSDTITPSTVVGLPTDTAITLTLDRVNSGGASLGSKVERITGIVSGSNLASYVRAKDRTTEQAHTGGAVIEMVWNAQDWNDMVDWGLVEHNQNGTHKAALITTLKANASDIVSGTSNSMLTTPKGLKDAGIVPITASDYLPSSYLDTDGTLAANSDNKIATQKAVKTYVASVGEGLITTTKYAPQGFLINGKIVPSVTSNNLTVAIKGMDGNDPSASNPVYCRIGDTVRTIVAALSVTKNAGTNYFNAGSTELATKEIDYFVFLGYNATDGVVIGFSRIPYPQRYDAFSTTSTNEKYCAISTITNAAAGDYYELIGRFAATLSAGAGYTWSVPTLTAANLIQHPIYQTRWLIWQPVYGGSGSMTYGTVTTNQAIYRIDYNAADIISYATGTTGGSASNSISHTFPIATTSTAQADNGAAWIYDSGVSLGLACITSTTLVTFYKYNASNFGIGANIQTGTKLSYPIN